MGHNIKSNMEGNPAPLKGIGVLVTRPAGRAASLCALLEKYGGRAVAFPVIDIAPPDDKDALVSALQRLEAVDLIIFVSAHAVHGVTEALGEMSPSIPPGTRVAAVGPKTAAQCERSAIPVDFVPHDKINSEGLLGELGDFDVAGANIIIFRGQSGRELLKQELELRGATVRYVESYRRTVANPPLAPLLAHWQKNQIHLAVVGSAAVMDALLEILGPRHRALLEAVPIFTYSDRVAAYCRTAGFSGDIQVAEKPTDESIVKAILKWAAI